MSSKTARRDRTIRNRCAASILGAALFALFGAAAWAHEVPSELTIEAFAKPSQQTLQVLVRVPLSGLMGAGLPKEGVGYLALDRIDPALRRTASQIADAIDIYEDGDRLGPPTIAATRISLPFDASFSSYEKALAHLMGAPLPAGTQVFWLQGSTDILFQYPIRSERSGFSLHVRLTTLAPQVTTSLSYLAPDGRARSFNYLGDAGRIWLDPSWYQAGKDALTRGWLRLFPLPDQWLFALCLLIPLQRFRSAQHSVGFFALGHLAAGIAIAYGPDSSGEWLLPLVETASAILLVYFALENIAAEHPARRWTTFVFGVISGIGFAIAMRDAAQFAGRHAFLSVLAFHLGLQLAQLVVVATVFAGLAVLSRWFVARRMRIIILSALVANAVWDMVTARAARLADVQSPLTTPDTLVNATSWLLIVVAVTGTLWLMSGLWRPRERGDEALPEKQRAYS